MKAYKNDKGHIMAVFKNCSGTYSVYKRIEEKGNFKIVQHGNPGRKERAAAEHDMVLLVMRSVGCEWESIDFRG